MKFTSFTFSKWFLALLVTALCLWGISFAQEATVMQEINDFVKPILWLLAWIWIVPATVAGELLSNDLVFGSKFNLTTYLRRVWTIMRTFANFFIWAMFLYFIFMQIFNSIKWDGLADFFDKMLRLLLAAILVNASFFLIRATVDLSIVATAAVSSLPRTVVANQRDEIKDKVKMKKTHCVVDREISTPNCDQTASTVVWIDKILPDANNMAGPIVFMWVAILDFLAADVVPNWTTNFETRALVTIIKIVLILLFTIPLIALMVVNMIRIVLIWIRTMFAPFIVIDLVFKDKSPLKLWDKLFYKNLTQLLGLIFVPVFVVGTLAIWFILMLGLTTVIKWWDAYAWTVTELQISGNPPVLAVPNVFDLSIEGNVFKPVAYRTLWFFGEVIMSLFAMLILWAMVKVSFSSSEIASHWSDKVFGLATKAMKAAPIVPLPWIWRTSVWALKRKWFVRNLTGVAALEQAAKIEWDQRAKDKFGFKDTTEFDLNYKDFVALEKDPAWVGKLSKVRELLVKSEKSTVSYGWNIQKLFETVSFDDFKTQGIFKEWFEEATFRNSEWYYKLVKDVIEGNFDLKNIGKKYIWKGKIDMRSMNFNV